MGTYLQLDHLSVGYNTVPVIEDINLDIQKGEVIALIGPNGAGKSTILKRSQEIWSRFPAILNWIQRIYFPTPLKTCPERWQSS